MGKETVKIQPSQLGIWPNSAEHVASKIHTNGMQINAPINEQIQAKNGLLICN
jgi:hypothetical protein